MLDDVRGKSKNRTERGNLTLHLVGQDFSKKVKKELTYGQKKNVISFLKDNQGYEILKRYPQFKKELQTLICKSVEVSHGRRYGMIELSRLAAIKYAIEVITALEAQPIGQKGKENQLRLIGEEEPKEPLQELKKNIEKKLKQESDELKKSIERTFYIGTYITWADHMIDIYRFENGIIPKTEFNQKEFSSIIKEFYSADIVFDIAMMNAVHENFDYKEAFIRGTYSRLFNSTYQELNEVTKNYTEKMSVPKFYNDLNTPSKISERKFHFTQLKSLPINDELKERLRDIPEIILGEIGIDPNIEGVNRFGFNRRGLNIYLRTIASSMRYKGGKLCGVGILNEDDLIKLKGDGHLDDQLKLKLLLNHSFGTFYSIKNNKKLKKERINNRDKDQKCFIDYDSLIGPVVDGFMTTITGKGNLERYFYDGTLLDRFKRVYKIFKEKYGFSDKSLDDIYEIK